MADIEKGNLDLMIAAVHAANAFMSKVQANLPVTEADINDAGVRKYLTMHAVMIQEFYDVLARGVGIWQEPAVHISTALQNPPAPIPGGGGGQLPPLPSQILAAAGQAAGQALGGIASAGS